MAYTSDPTADAERSLARLRTARTRLRNDLDIIDREISAKCAELLEDGQSASSIARLLGVSHTHVRALADRHNPDAIEWRMPILSGWQAGEYVRGTGRSVTRVLGAFDSAELLFMSGLHPKHFISGPGHLWIPNMAWQLDDESWVGVDNVNVGYLGTGPRQAREALEELALAPDVIDQIAESRLTDFDLVSETMKPVKPLGLDSPEPVGNAYVVRLTRTALISRESASASHPPAYTAFDRHTPGHFHRWVSYLDRNPTDLPEWIRGERMARVFLSDDEAEKQGFTDRGSVYAGGTYPLVLEQGSLQLWIPTYSRQDSQRLLSDEVYAALRDAHLYPTSLAEFDNRSKWVRYLDSWRGSRQTIGPYVDVSPSGGRTLSHHPLDMPDEG